MPPNNKMPLGPLVTGTQLSMITWSIWPIPSVAKGNQRGCQTGQRHRDSKGQFEMGGQQRRSIAPNTIKGGMAELQQTRDAGDQMHRGGQQCENHDRVGDLVEIAASGQRQHRRHHHEKSGQNKTRPKQAAGGCQIRRVHGRPRKYRVEKKSR